MRRQEDIDFAGSDLQNPEGGGLGLGTGKTRPRCPLRPACCKEKEERGRSLRLASARCWRTTAAAEAAAAGEQEHRTASRPVGRAEAMRMESGGRRTHAREIEGATLAPVDYGREKSEVVEQIEWGSKDVGAVDAADVFVVEIELELELQPELEVCLTLARPGEDPHRLHSLSMPNPSCRPILVCLLVQRLSAGCRSLGWNERGRWVCAWENSDENRGELSRVSQTLAPPTNGGLVRLSSSCLPASVGRLKVRTKERQLLGYSTSTMPCSGVVGQWRAKSYDRGGGGGGGREAARASRSRGEVVSLARCKQTGPELSAYGRGSHRLRGRVALVTVELMGAAVQWLKMNCWMDWVVIQMDQHGLVARQVNERLRLNQARASETDGL